MRSADQPPENQPAPGLTAHNMEDRLGRYMSTAHIAGPADWAAVAASAGRPAPTLTDHLLACDLAGASATQRRRRAGCPHARSAWCPAHDPAGLPPRAAVTGRAGGL